MGGGHDLAFPEALGLMKSFPKKKIGFLNIDAHLDLRPTHNGITSGSPWYLVRENSHFDPIRSKIVEFGIQPHCNAHSLLLYAKEKKIEILWLKNLKKAAAVFKRELGKLSQRDAIQVSLDIDSIKSSEAPGCSAPQTFGFSPDEIISMCEMSGMNKKVRSFGIYEVSPPLDHDGRTVSLAAQCLWAFIKGFSTRQRK